MTNVVRYPTKELRAHRDEDFVSEWQLLSIFDTLPPTATGLDHLPASAYILRLGAPVFSKPLVILFNKSLTTSTVPLQWKRAFIQPVPKTASPLVHFGQYLLPLSSVGHLNVLLSSSFYILPFSPLLPLFLSQSNSQFVRSEYWPMNITFSNRFYLKVRKILEVNQGFARARRLFTKKWKFLIFLGCIPTSLRRLRQNFAQSRCPSALQSLTCIGATSRP